LKKLNQSINPTQSGGEKKNANNLYIFLLTLICIISLILDVILSRNTLFIPLILSLGLTIISTQFTYQKLKSLKLKQIIRREGPKKHYKKSGTPSMGGIAVIPISLLVGNLFNINNESSLKLLTLSILSLSFMLIGLIDDWRSFSLKKNLGLSPKEKIVLQCIAAIVFLLTCASNNWINPNIYIYGDYMIKLGLLIWPVALFILIAESNATNLTDGLDGLASGCGSIVFTGLSIELVFQGSNESYAMASFCMAMAGSWLGFLLHNKNPAKIFMGDTGSLAMGASLAGISLITNTLWSLLIMGIIFLIESISVIIQVGFFKISKKLRGQGHRILKMAPLHHHFELNGQNEIKIVRNFWFITINFVILKLLFL